LKYNRFIAIGDSFTEGMCDEKKYGQYRGWADRVADVMAQAQPGFQYANLSIRGKLCKCDFSTSKAKGSSSMRILLIGLFGMI